MRSDRCRTQQYASTEDKGMMRIVRQQIVGVVLVTLLFIEGGVLAICDSFSLQTCVNQLASYDRQVQSGLISYTESELASVCQRFNEITVCVRRATSTCPHSGGSGAKTPVDSTYDYSQMPSPTTKKRLWAGLESSFRYMCDQKRNVYLKNSQCLSTQPVQTSIKVCNRTYHMEKEFAHTDDKKHCLITNEFLSCLHEVIKKRCGDEAAVWVFTVVQKLRQPNMELLHGCTLAGNQFRSSSLLLMMTTLTIRSLL